MKNIVYPIRTQISLSAKLKDAIESQCTIYGESMSEYVRKAVKLRMDLDDSVNADLKELANTFVNAVPKTKSGWKDTKNAAKWVHDLRRERGE